MCEKSHTHAHPPMCVYGLFDRVWMRGVEFSDVFGKSVLSALVSICVFVLRGFSLRFLWYHGDLRVRDENDTTLSRGINAATRC